MEVERALADLAEVRDRLASCQQFRGYSGPAAAFSGIGAIAAGVVQLIAAPYPATESQIQTYLLIWSVCLGVALVANYGALAIWYVRTAGVQARSQTRTAGLSILPAVVLGAILSAALYLHGLYVMLPGVWYACYAVGLFASRAMVPQQVAAAGIFFAFAGAALLLAPESSLPLSWWVMPLGFGVVQTYIGWVLARDEESFETA
ncbi:MAG TPA: hypothetical protein VJN22_00260 [Candidatus Eremiobacteraceae bacterium]|nr:hypothetical protein [Candidatus Eremiobacteraceae bacterium]